MANSRLDSTLRSLVQRHGLGNVLRSLGEIASRDSESASAEPSIVHRRLTETKGRPRHKPTAQEYVSRMTLPLWKEAVVSEFAVRFDRRTFLPTFSDIAHFCQIYGIDVPASKSRASAIPRVFRFIASEMDAREAQRILDDGLFSGPSQLGPIADAIRRTGRASRRSRLAE